VGYSRWITARYHECYHSRQTKTLQRNPRDCGRQRSRWDCSSLGSSRWFEERWWRSRKRRREQGRCWSPGHKRWVSWCCFLISVRTGETKSIAGSTRSKLTSKTYISKLE
jgi:hypothetical protein